jgi:hypothetical protein
MDVDDKFELCNLVDSVEIFFSPVNFWMKILSRLFPDSIQVVSRQIRSVVAVINTISIDHREYIEMEIPL